MWMRRTSVALTSTSSFATFSLGILAMVFELDSAGATFEDGDLVFVGLVGASRFQSLG